MIFHIFGKSKTLKMFFTHIKHYNRIKTEKIAKFSRFPCTPLFYGQNPLSWPKTYWQEHSES